MGDLGQANRYSYAANDPVNATDPNGTCAKPAMTPARPWTLEGCTLLPVDENGWVRIWVRSDPADRAVLRRAQPWWKVLVRETFGAAIPDPVPGRRPGPIGFVNRRMGGIAWGQIEFSLAGEREIEWVPDPAGSFVAERTSAELRARYARRLEQLVDKLNADYAAAEFAERRGVSREGAQQQARIHYSEVAGRR